MKVLLTGALGNIGLQTIQALLNAGHFVKAFDLPTATNMKVARKHKLAGHNNLKIVWGNILDEALLAKTVSDIDAVIHLAAILPPLSDLKPDLAYTVNVQGTKNLIRTLEENAKNARFIFTSTVAVNGYQVIKPLQQIPLRTSTDDLAPIDAYSKHKVACEAFLKNSQLRWVVLRIGVCFGSEKAMKVDLNDCRMQFRVRPSARLEYVHPIDVASALSNAVIVDDVEGKTLLIGGGAACQTTFGAMIQKMFNGVGVTLNDDIYGNENYFTEWMDTRESQRLLNYQRHTLEDMEREVRNRMRLIRCLVWPIRPLVLPIFKRIVTTK